MRIPTLKLVRYLVAYLLGAFLIGWGLWCFGYELLYPEETAREAVSLYFGNIFCGVIICWGTILVLTSYYHYAGGIWTYPVLEVEAKVEPFENGRGFSLRVFRADKPRGCSATNER
jgi:hypothetical protein